MHIDYGATAFTMALYQGSKQFLTFPPSEFQKLCPDRDNGGFVDIKARWVHCTGPAPNMYPRTSSLQPLCRLRDAPLERLYYMLAGGMMWWMMNLGTCCR